MALDEDRTGRRGTNGTDQSLRAAQPTCTNCGERPAPEAYTLHFRREAARDRELDLQLCEECLAEICSEPTVERA